MERDSKVIKKVYEWTQGETLGEHSKRKHKIIREYFFDYIRVRCSLPYQQCFRLAIIDGFSGSGRYECGTAGSPLIFLEELKRALEAVNLRRATQGAGPLKVEGLMICNDADRDATELLKSNLAPLQHEISQSLPTLHLEVKYLNSEFEISFPKIKQILNQRRFGNVIFNLDQSGHSHVDRSTIVEIIRTYPHAEIFYTFVISSLLAFLRKTDPNVVRRQLGYLGLVGNDLKPLEGVMSRKDWLGAAERLVFEAFRTCAPFVSPFSINNRNGWQYWLIHFANATRARQVYNNILHANASLQAHFGRSGLNMLAYDNSHEDGILYLFDRPSRELAKEQLLNDIPKTVAEFGDAVLVREFYEGIYNHTPAHSDDIHASIIENPDLEVITPAGGERRSANAIGAEDILKLKRQRSFFPMFFDLDNDEKGKE